MMSLLHLMESEREAVVGSGEALVGRAEIDTSSPFRSVKEAVILFGEKVLAGEIANKLNEMRAAANVNEQSVSRLGSLVAELEDTKQNLEKAQQERQELEIYLASLRQELYKTKAELKQLKARELEKPATDSEIEDIKFVENSTETMTEMPAVKEDSEFQRKKYVKFANPPSLARVMSTDEQNKYVKFANPPTLARVMSTNEPVLNRRFSIDSESSQRNKKKKTKKSLLPRIVSAFLKKKSFQGEESVQAQTVA